MHQCSESISQPIATPFGNLDQPLYPESLPLRFRSMTDGRSVKAVVVENYEKGIKRSGANSALPVVFTALFSMRTSCVEVSSVDFCVGFS